MPYLLLCKTVCCFVACLVFAQFTQFWVKIWIENMCLCKKIDIFDVYASGSRDHVTLCLLLYCNTLQCPGIKCCSQFWPHAVQICIVFRPVFTSCSPPTEWNTGARIHTEQCCHSQSLIVLYCTVLHCCTALYCITLK